VLAEQNIVVDMIAQNIGSSGKAAIGFTVLKNELASVLALLTPLAAELGAQVRHEEEVSKVSIVGTGMRTHTGVAERMFAALADDKINMKMITTGDIKISVLVDKADGARALRAVHQAFKLAERHPGAGLTGAGGVSLFPPRPQSVIEEPSGKDLVQQASRLASMEEIVISEILLNTEEGRITIFDIPDKAGNCSRVFQAVAQAGIVVDMIVQNLSSPGRAELSFSVPRKDLDGALARTEAVLKEMDNRARVVADANIARLFVFGVGMRTHTGVARRMFGALAKRGINIAMINTSEVCVSVVVDLARAQDALAGLKEAFTVA
jgi:aspartate kinase